MAHSKSRDPSESDSRSRDVGKKLEHRQCREFLHAFLCEESSHVRTRSEITTIVSTWYKRYTGFMI